MSNFSNIDCLFTLKTSIKLVNRCNFKENFLPANKEQNNAKIVALYWSGEFIALPKILPPQ